MLLPQKTPDWSGCHCEGSQGYLILMAPKLVVSRFERLVKGPVNGYVCR
jgi:hypothetical protein